MSEVTGYYEKIQSEETEFKAAVGEKVMEKIAATINKALDDFPPLPVGTIQKSMLTLEQFQEIMSDKWVLCLGQDVTGSAYHTLTGKTIAPQMYGRFTRMKDHGAGRNEAGDLSLGAIQYDQLEDHTHSLTYNMGGASNHDTVRNFDSGSTRELSLGTQLANMLTITVGSTGGNESRPENVTVNYFIKIN